MCDTDSVERALYRAWLLVAHSRPQPAAHDLGEAPARALVVRVPEIVHVPRLAGTQDPVLAPRVLGCDDDRRPVPGVRVLHQAEEPVLDHRRLGHDNDMRRVSLIMLAQDRRCGEPARIPAHHLQHRDGGLPAHRLHVPPDAHGGQRDESRGAPIPRRVVGGEQVVVDGLGHVDDGQGQPRASRLQAERVPGLRRVVAADDEAVSDAHRLDLLQRRLDIARAELPAGRSEDAAGGARDGVPARARMSPSSTSLPSAKPWIPLAAPRILPKAGLRAAVLATPARLMFSTAVLPPDCITRTLLGLAAMCVSRPRGPARPPRRGWRATRA